MWHAGQAISWCGRAILWRGQAMASCRPWHGASRPAGRGVGSGPSACCGRAMARPGHAQRLQTTARSGQAMARFGRRARACSLGGAPQGPRSSGGTPPPATSTREAAAWRPRRGGAPPRRGTRRAGEAEGIGGCACVWVCVWGGLNQSERRTSLGPRGGAFGARPLGTSLSRYSHGPLIIMSPPGSCRFPRAARLGCAPTRARARRASRSLSSSPRCLLCRGSLQNRACFVAVIL